MKHYKNDLEFRWAYQGLKRLKSIYRFYSGNKCINNINSMFQIDVKITFSRYAFKRFY